MAERRLVIDGQILQTTAWHRGMGRYTLQVLQALSALADPGLELVVVFNTALVDDPERYRIVRSMCPRVAQLQARLPLPTDLEATCADYRDGLEKCLGELPPVPENYYLLAALFTFDFFAEYPAGFQRLLLFYDLTPLLFWKDLGGYFPPGQYMARFGTILAAQQIFAISETTRQDLLQVFGLDPSTVVNVGGGFTRHSETSCHPKGFPVPDHYILFPTGSMPHKNNSVALRGYNEYCEQNDQAVGLVVTSEFPEHIRRRLEELSKGAVFAGNVADDELEWLYQHADLILFASKYEGLGMPVLDALATGKAVVTSRISVFKEMSEDAFYFFDPGRPDELAEVLGRALAGEGLSDKVASYGEVIGRYTWEKTGRAILDRMPPPEAASDFELALEPARPVPAIRPRVAVVGLHPGLEGQIGRLAEPLYSSLRIGYDVDFYFDANGHRPEAMSRPTFLDYLPCGVYDVSALDFDAYRRYGRLLYLLDEHAFPSRVAQRACVMPGVAITGLACRADSPEGEMASLALANQYASVPLEDSYLFYRGQVASLLRSSLEAPRDGRASRAEAIIRSGRRDRNIVNQLKRLT